VGCRAGLGVVMNAKIFFMPGIELLSSSFCAVALLLTLTRRFGVEPHVLMAVTLITDCCMTMELASETSDFYASLRRLIELETVVTSNTYTYMEWQKCDRTRLNYCCRVA